MLQFPTYLRFMKTLVKKERGYTLKGRRLLGESSLILTLHETLTNKSVEYALAMRF